MVLRLFKRLNMIDLSPYNTELFDFCNKNQIKKLSLFGSALREDYDPETSDIDLLVEFIQGMHPSIFGLAGMEDELSDLLNKKIDLRTKEDLSILFRNQVVDNSKTIYIR